MYQNLNYIDFYTIKYLFNCKVSKYNVKILLKIK